MGRAEWIDDRLFVLEQMVRQMLRRLSAQDREEILSALATTCEGSPGALAMVEDLLAWEHLASERPEHGADLLLRNAERMNAIYGDRKS